MSIKSFIKWSGSKRTQAEEIISLFPKKIDVYYEPFLGSGSILGHLKPAKATCGDVYEPLVKLWINLQKDPTFLSDGYEKKWDILQGNYKYFYQCRSIFNKEKDPLDLLFLSRTCVNGLMRFNSSGDFNNSLHYTRPGIKPESLKKIIFTWSSIIRNYKFKCGDYRETTRDAKRGDFIYLDPPYFYNKARYIETINYNDFVNFLEYLNKKGILFALSYDGKRGEKAYETSLPKELYKRHFSIKSGNSPFRKLQDKKREMVYESLYLNY